MYDEVSADQHLHPDDDFEAIEARMVDKLEREYGHPEDAGFALGSVDRSDTPPIDDLHNTQDPYDQDDPAPMEEGTYKSTYMCSKGHLVKANSSVINIDSICPVCKRKARKDVERPLDEGVSSGTSYATYEEFRNGAAERGLEVEVPYADAENGPSSTDPYETVMVKNAEGDYVGQFWHEGPEPESSGIIFDDSNEFYRWANENDMQDQDTPDEYSDDMDGDFDSGMRDAGMGTDEDYGTPADEMYEADPLDDMKKLSGIQEAKKDKNPDMLDRIAADADKKKDKKDKNK
jgi:hypothetical protein